MKEGGIGIVQPGALFASGADRKPWGFDQGTAHRLKGDWFEDPGGKSGREGFFEGVGVEDDGGRVGADKVIGRTNRPRTAEKAGSVSRVVGRRWGGGRTGFGSEGTETRTRTDGEPSSCFALAQEWKWPGTTRASINPEAMKGARQGPDGVGT